MESEAYPEGMAQPTPPTPREHIHCWICARTSPRTATGMWAQAMIWDDRMERRVSRWVCSPVCRTFALLLLNGILSLDRPAA